MSDPRLCVTVAGKTMDEICQARDAAAAADIVEVRLDGVAEPDVARAIKGRRCPVIVTCRPTWEGGAFAGSEDERRRMLERALFLGSEFVDIEAAAPFAAEMIRPRAGRGIVLSMHAFDRMPEDLRSRYAAMRATGAEVVKLAVQVNCLADMLPLFDLAATEDAGPHVLIAMGDAGIASRVLAARLGNRWSYAGNGIAPGQLSAARMVEEFRFPRIRSDAAIYGVTGNPVAHSRSPAMHNAGFEALGLNAVYVPLPAHTADDFVRWARAMNLHGASITAPWKVALMQHVDEVDDLARRVGAINTIVVRNGRWIGGNTDVEGVLAPLARRVQLKGVRATVLGAGGAARAVVVALANQGASVTVSARSTEKARAVADLAGGSVGPCPPPRGSWDLLVNATPHGSASDPGHPMAGASLDGEIVFDLIYAPRETQLLAEARAAGCLTIGGLEMLVAQAERQFELWTGSRPPDGLFMEAAEAIETAPRPQRPHVHL